MSGIQQYDVLIVGAGASGIMAAWECAAAGKKVALIEARNRIGGRVHTVHHPAFPLPLEKGAEFVHGQLTITREWLRKAAIDRQKVEGGFYRKAGNSFEPQQEILDDFTLLREKYKELKDDMPVAVFMAKYLDGDRYSDLRDSLKRYVEGYHAADPGHASLFALRRELEESEDEQYWPQGGYGPLLAFMYNDAKNKGVQTYLSHPVTHIQWSEGEVQIGTDQTTFTGKSAIITVSLGVWQAGSIGFQPQLDLQQRMAASMGFGAVVKCTLVFRHAFWKDSVQTGADLTDMGFLFSEEEIPTWWTHFPDDAPQLTGWVGGPAAMVMSSRSDEAILAAAITSLARIFNMEQAALQPVAWDISNWQADPYSRGGYAYEVVNGASFRNRFKQPLKKTLYFAGEALYDGPDFGTVEAALHSGREAAQRLISGM